MPTLCRRRRRFIRVRTQLQKWIKAVGRLSVQCAAMRRSGALWRPCPPSWTRSRAVSGRVVGDPFDLRIRPMIPAITTLLLLGRENGEATFFLHWRDPGKAATAGGLYDAIPAGEFQPSSVLVPLDGDVAARPLLGSENNRTWFAERWQSSCSCAAKMPRRERAGRSSDGDEVDVLCVERRQVGADVVRVAGEDDSAAVAYCRDGDQGVHYVWPFLWRQIRDTQGSADAMPLGQVQGCAAEQAYGLSGDCRAQCAG